jgi:hypothetical protein
MAKGSNKQVQGKYASYKTSGTCAKNKARKIAKHLKAQPNDKQAELALLNGAGHIRKAPNTTQWTSPKKEFAQLLASIVQDKTKTNIKGMFSIQTRVRYSA